MADVLAAAQSNYGIFILLGILVSLTTLLGIVWRVSKWWRIQSRKFDQLFGVKASQGIVAVPSVVERLKNVETTTNANLEQIEKMNETMNRMTEAMDHFHSLLTSLYKNLPCSHTDLPSLACLETFDSLDSKD